MIKKAYYLSTCSTCSRILKELGNDMNDFELQDIKENNITIQQIEDMNALSGSYESLFSRRAMKYKSLGLANEKLTENRYKELIMDEYTFLKRPVFIFGDKIFIGNSKKEIDSLKEALCG